MDPNKPPEQVSQQAETTIEQVEKPVPNPNGKGGFGDHPENINIGGRPKNEVSIVYWIKQFLEGMEDKHDKTRAQELAEKIVTMAYLEGNVPLIKEILDRIEGTNPIRFADEKKDIRELLEGILANERKEKPAEGGDNQGDTGVSK